MIREGELVVYGSEGVCRVEKIGPLEQGGQAYFTLTPLYGNGAAFVPVARESALRPALDREEALALIRRMLELECVPEADGKEREAEYLRLLRSHDSEAWLAWGRASGSTPGSARKNAGEASGRNASANGRRSSSSGSWRRPWTSRGRRCRKPSKGSFPGRRTGENDRFLCNLPRKGAQNGQKRGI